MGTWIALVRGVNVVGRHRLPMKDFKVLLEEAGCTDVQTYLQSGNAVFRAPASGADALASSTTRLAAAIADGVSARHGFKPHVLVLSRAELARAAAGNPFREARSDPKSVHVFFLAERPRRPDLKSLKALSTSRERFALKGRAFYLHTPGGFGTSKVAGRVEKHLGVEATARNWRTVTALVDLAKTGTCNSA